MPATQEPGFKIPQEDLDNLSTLEVYVKFFWCCTVTSRDKGWRGWVYCLTPYCTC